VVQTEVGTRASSLTKSQEKMDNMKSEKFKKNEELMEGGAWNPTNLLTPKELTKKLFLPDPRRGDRKTLRGGGGRGVGMKRSGCQRREKNNGWGKKTKILTGP